LVEGFELEISKELHGEKAKAQVLARSLLRLDNPAIADKAFKVMQGAEDIAPEVRGRFVSW
jgi:hypothetical protein